MTPAALLPVVSFCIFPPSRDGSTGNEITQATCQVSPGQGVDGCLRSLTHANQRVGTTGPLPLASE